MIFGFFCLTFQSNNGQLNEILTDMENNYSTAKICPFEQQSVEYADEEPVDKLHCNLALEPGWSSSIYSCQLHIFYFISIFYTFYSYLCKTIFELFDRIDQNFN